MLGPSVDQMSHCIDNEASFWQQNIKHTGGISDSIVGIDTREAADIQPKALITAK